jgi:hypothetical protein
MLNCESTNTRGDRLLQLISNGINNIRWHNTTFRHTIIGMNTSLVKQIILLKPSILFFLYLLMYIVNTPLAKRTILLKPSILIKTVINFKKINSLLIYTKTNLRMITLVFSICVSIACHISRLLVLAFALSCYHLVNVKLRKYQHAR